MDEAWLGGVCVRQLSEGDGDGKKEWGMKLRKKKKGKEYNVEEKNEGNE